MNEQNIISYSGHSVWFCLNEFVDNNVTVIKKLSWVEPSTVCVTKIDQFYSQITAYHNVRVSKKEES